MVCNETRCTVLLKMHSLTQRICSDVFRCSNFFLNSVGLQVVTTPLLIVSLLQYKLCLRQDSFKFSKLHQLRVFSITESVFFTEKSYNNTVNVRITKNWGAFVNNCCSWKALSIKYSECVLVASGIQDAICMRHIFICGLSGFTIFFPHYLINGTILEKVGYWT